VTDQIGIGVIGAGGISHSHILAYRSRVNREAARVVAIADIDEARARQQAKQYEIPRVFTDWRDMLALPEVQAVSVCTPPFLHVEQSVEALRAGKHVICEKPVAPSLAGLDAIAAAQRASGRVFSGVFQHRMGQGARQMKWLLDQGRFGLLRFGLTETLWQRGPDYYGVWWRGTWEKEAGGVTMGHGIHGIDTLLWLMGEPQSLVADAATVKLDIAVEDTSAAIVRFRGGAMGQLTVTVNAQDNRSRLEIFGDELQAVAGDAAYDLTAQPVRFVALDPAKAEAAARDAQAACPEETRHLHVPMMADFLAACRGEREPLVSVAECRRSMELITALYRSAMTGERVRFPIEPDDPFYSVIPPEGFGLREITRA
jgi:predicted dehydrogenase